ncbi:uncharacterized protein FTOL_12412 [Fusarium torulosum]|uniref:Uncharacterized protein n=1 Tax=Fusarium torulosum TaxID=33205 RepID=A0AAE8MK40_9HYPO|nr:uncharacterized protein FTOL_12412 [Fusarium torulosum]
MYQKATAIAPFDDDFVYAFLLAQHSTLPDYDVVNLESCQAQPLYLQGVTANPLYEGPNLQSLDVCYAPPDEDIGAKDAPALPSYDYFTSFTSFGTGVSTKDFAMFNQSYEFPQSKDLIPAFHPLGAHINPTGFLETACPYETTFLESCLPLSETGINGIDHTALYQSFEEDISARSYGVSSLEASTYPAVRAEATNIPSPLLTLRSSGVASTYLATNSTSPISLNGESATAAKSFDDTTSHRQQNDTQISLSIPSDSPLMSTHRKPVGVEEYIDLTKDDEPDAGILRLGLPELRPGRTTESVVTGASKLWIPLSADVQPWSGSKRKRACEKNSSQTHQTKPKKTKLARLQAPSSSTREKSSRLGDDQLRLEVKEILFQNQEGVELSSHWTSGKWSLPLDRNEITSITFTVNSGNFSQLCFYKVKRNDMQDELWECEDIEGIYEISLSEDEIVELMNKPKGGLLKTYVLSKP